MKLLSTAFLLLVITFSAAAQKREYFDFYGEKTKPEYAFRYKITTEVKNAAGETRYEVKSYYMSDRLEKEASFADKKQKVKDGFFASYDEMERKTEEMNYSKNELDGRYIEYFENSSQVAKECFYKDGDLQGSYTTYYENGIVRTKKHFSGGKADGESLIYHENGQLEDQRTYVDGKEKGDAFEYYETGKLGGETHYVDGNLQGECRWYYLNGQVSSIEQYEADSLLHFELFNEDGTPDLVSISPGNGPEYPGGTIALRKFLATHLNYPETAINHGLQGRVFLTFTVTPEGKIKDIEVLRGVPDCPECDKEAMRVIKAMPNWNAGKSHNRSLDQEYNLPISFKLQ